MTDTTSETIQKTSIALHQEVKDQLVRWEKMYDCFQDEYWIKSKSSLYLSIPSGISSKAPNTQTGLYDAYKKRSIYYRYLSSDINKMKSMLTKKKVEFELPKKMLSLIEDAGQDGESLNTIVDTLFQNQLLYSRYGLLVDIPEKAKGMDVIPHLVEYGHNTIVNWVTDTVNGKEIPVVIILDQSYDEITAGLQRKLVENYRILALANYDTNPIYYSYETDSTGVNAFELNQDIPEDAYIPNIREKTLPYIPFQICNALSLAFETEIPILIEIADMALALYQGEADYRQSLFMQGQATPYVAGASSDLDKIAFGATALIKFTDTDAHGGFIEVEGKGLAGMKAGLDGLHAQEDKLGVSLIEAGANQSGEALGVRLGVQTASLVGVSNINKQCLKNVLKIIADWMDENEEEIGLTYTTDFMNSQKSIDELIKLADLTKENKYALEDFYNYLKRNDYTAVNTFEEWKDKIQTENGELIDEETQRIMDEIKAGEQTETKAEE